MRPLPMAPMLMRLLGAYAPKTEEGTMVGKFILVDAATPPIIAVFTKVRRDIVEGFFMDTSSAASRESKTNLAKNKSGRGASGEQRPQTRAPPQVSSSLMYFG